jgi:ubiquinone/menaquinone biosynthesis C-methylase UbiE
MSEFKQSWWDKNLEKKYDIFATWVGDSNAPSKKYFRKYVKDHEYKSLIDLGCGNATEYFAYKEEYPELKYIGVDSSEFLNNRNSALGVSMILASAENVPLESGCVDVVFCRHVLEHQPSFEPVLAEMIRLAKHEAIHVFFIAPDERDTHIGYSASENLYHNRYNINDIENFLKILNLEFKWIDISNIEKALVIKKPS